MKEDRASFISIITREVIRQIVLLQKKSDHMIAMGARYAENELPWRPPFGFVNEKYDVFESRLEILKKKGAHSGKLIFQLHGGAYYIGLMNIYRKLAVSYIKKLGYVSVASLDYRIAPKYTYPAALDDALAAWELLLELGYRHDDIILVGDSAGGNLALALAQKLRDENKPMPLAIVCMSPWTDMAAQGASYVENLYRDPLFGTRKNACDRYDEKSHVFCYLGDADRTDKYLSPAYGSFEDFPPMLLQVGTYERLQSDSVTVYEKAAAAGVDATLMQFPGMFHVFQLIRWLPESRTAWKEIFNFMEKHFLR